MLAALMLLTGASAAQAQMALTLVSSVGQQNDINNPSSGQEGPEGNCSCVGLGLGEA